MFEEITKLNDAAVRADRSGDRVTALKLYKRLNEMTVSLIAQYQLPHKTLQQLETLRERTRARCAEIENATPLGRGVRNSNARFEKAVGVSRKSQHSADSMRSPDAYGTIDRLARNTRPPASAEVSTGATTTSSDDKYTLPFDEYFKPSSEQITFEDVIGHEEAKKAILEAITLPAKFGDLLPKGVSWSAILLFGPPGSGKTMLASAVAASLNITFGKAVSADLVTEFVGEPERNLRQLFEAAVRHAPCVLFLDEVDGICGLRTSKDGVNNRRFVNTFLDELTKLDKLTDKRVLLLAATNHPWEIDPAAWRRFQRRYYIDLPNLEARRALFKKELCEPCEGRPPTSLLSDMDLLELAKRSEGFTGSDIDNVCRALKVAPFKACEGAQHFRPVEVDGKRKYLPLPLDTGCRLCKPCAGHITRTDPEAIPLRMVSFSKREMIIPQLQWSDVYNELIKHKSSVTPESLERYQQWQ